VMIKHAASLLFTCGDAISLIISSVPCVYKQGYRLLDSWLVF